MNSIVAEILQVICSENDPNPIPSEFCGVPVGPDRRCCGPRSETLLANQPWNYQSIATNVISLRHRRLQFHVSLDSERVSFSGSRKMDFFSILSTNIKTETVFGTKSSEKRLKHIERH